MLQTLFTAGVVPVGGVEQPAQRRCHPRPDRRRGVDQLTGLQFTHQAGGQIAPAHQGVVAHVATNVGQLHRDAQVDGVWQRCGRAHVQRGRHHQAHGAGDLIAVVQQRVDVGHAHVLQVAGHAADQFQRDGRVDFADLHQLQHVGGGFVWALSTLQDLPNAVEFGPRRVAVNGLVGRVVNTPAKAVQAGGALGMLFTQQAPRPVETVATAGQQPVGGAVDRSGRHGSGAHASWLSCRTTIWACGTSASTTLAEHNTPGKPAPGCVPAPTR